MKQFFNFVLVSVFMIGISMTATADMAKSDEEKPEVYMQKDCVGEFSSCNGKHPSDYARFEACMLDYGC